MENTNAPVEKTRSAARCSLDRLVRMPAWTASKAEEIIAVAWLVAGCSAWNAGIRWLGWVCFAKATLDTICAIGVAIMEVRAESAKHPNDQAHV